MNTIETADTIVSVSTVSTVSTVVDVVDVGNVNVSVNFAIDDDVDDDVDVGTVDTISKNKKISIIYVRGIYCINTLPNELIWGLSGTCLECKTCIKYGTDKLTNIFIGMCYICSYMYEGKYGCGYFSNLKGYKNNVPVAFGDLSTEDILNQLQSIVNQNPELRYPLQIANNPKHVYSIFNMASLYNNDINLLSKQNNDGWQIFKNYYNCDNDTLMIIIETILKLKNKYNIIDIINNTGNLLFNNEFYKECENIEKFFKVTSVTGNNILLDTRILQETQESQEPQETHKNKCGYCEIQKPKAMLRKCEGCKNMKYCSIICQRRDWVINHKKICSFNCIVNVVSVEPSRLIEDVD